MRTCPIIDPRPFNIPQWLRPSRRSILIVCSSRCNQWGLAPLDPLSEPEACKYFRRSFQRKIRRLHRLGGFEVEFINLTCSQPSQISWELGWALPFWGRHFCWSPSHRSGRTCYRLSNSWGLEGWTLPQRPLNLSHSSRHYSRRNAHRNHRGRKLLRWLPVSHSCLLQFWFRLDYF